MTLHLDGRMPSRVLVVGGGGREHALVWSLSRDAGVDEILVAPGNPLITDVAECLPHVRPDDIAGIVALARERAVDLVVVGPEAPLVVGLVDALDAAGIAAFGPTAAAAAIEGSKRLCREVAREAGVAVADGEAFDAVGPAVAYARRIGAPVVIKADGLAQGKGVTVCGTLAEAEAALHDALEAGVFGEAGRTVVVERAMRGPELSVISICDGETALALPAARDHKRLREGDEGPNTGGMGAYAPVPDISDTDLADLVVRFHVPLLRAMAARGTPFRGALFAGLMLTEEGPRLLECNARFGDPETQALLPLLTAPLAPLLLAAAHGRLAAHAADLGLRGVLLPTSGDTAVAVVLAADGYPQAPRGGDAIRGIDEARDTGALVFGAGVATSAAGEVVTSGGRVLSVVGRGTDIDAAAAAAYGAASRIHFDGMALRRDIGRTAIASTPAARA